MEETTYYVEFLEGSGPVTKELGHMTIDRKSLAIVPKGTTMKLSDEDFRKLVEDLTGKSDPRGNKVVGQFANGVKWHEGRAEAP
jgi:hypothetical protein